MARRVASTTLVAVAALVAITIAIAPRRAHAFALAQHLHLIYAHFGCVAVLPTLLVGPLAGANAALNVNLRAFAQILPCNFGQTASKHQSVPLGMLAHIASLLVFPLVCGGYSNIGDLVAIGKRTHLWIAPEIANKNHFID